jgi:hypothetical protein
MLFHLLKLGNQFILEVARNSVLRGIYYLVRLKVSTYKQVGIKLASLALHWGGEEAKKIEE